MKKRLCIMLVLALTLVLGTVTTAFADAAVYDMNPANYYVYVLTPDGGLNMRHGPGSDYSKALDGVIPDGTELYIGYTSGDWGYTEYKGHSGWVYLPQTTRTAPVAESYQKVKAGYNVYVAAPDGGVNLRQGPDKTYQKVMTEIIPNNIKLYIEYYSGDWGYTTYNGYKGWIFLPQTTTKSPTANTEKIEESVPATIAEDLEEDEKTADKEVAEETEIKEETNNDEAVETSKKQESDSEKVKDSMFSQVMLGAALLVAVTVIAIIILIYVNNKTKRR